MDEKEEVMTKKETIITLIILAVIIVVILVSILVTRKLEKPKEITERIEAAVISYNSDSNILEITTSEGNTAKFRGYSVTFEATAETTTITLNKGKTNEIIITLTEGEE